MLAFYKKIVPRHLCIYYQHYVTKIFNLHYSTKYFAIVGLTLAGVAGYDWFSVLPLLFKLGRH